MHARYKHSFAGDLISLVKVRGSIFVRISNLPFVCSNASCILSYVKVHVTETERGVNTFISVLPFSICGLLFGLPRVTLENILESC